MHISCEFMLFTVHLVAYEATMIISILNNSGLNTTYYGKNTVSIAICCENVYKIISIAFISLIVK